MYYDMTLKELRNRVFGVNVKILVIAIWNNFSGYWVYLSDYLLLDTPATR